ncbi:hypothetical protein AB837_00377 [bacterium AB1]|nr:hypothetical protein AB837_00377 [bacterium AB1]
MKVYITPNPKDYLKIFKKKISYDGRMESFKRKKNFLSKKRLSEVKRIKKHAFLKHFNNSKNIFN